MFKFAILVAIFGYMQAVELDDILIREGNEIVKEHIMLDRQRGLQTYHTGKHCGRKGVTEMIDSDHGVVASKFDREDGDRLEKFCVIQKYDAEIDMNPNQAARALKLAHNKMPNDVEEIKKYFLYDVYKNAEQLPQTIKDFCAGLQIVRAKEVTMENVNKIALEEALAAKKNSRKRAVVREFTACTNESTMVLMTCGGDKLYTLCKVRRTSCTYKISCPLDMNSGGFNCKGLHKFNSPICCDYHCRK